MHKDLIRLAQQPTPSFFYVPSCHQHQLHSFLQYIEKTPLPIQVLYSMKTNDHPLVLKSVADAIAAMEVISHRELKKALSLPKVKTSTVNGPAKSEALMRLAIEHNAMLTIDHEEEWSRCNALAKAVGKTVNVGLRLNVANNANLHKFGVPVEPLLNGGGLGDAMLACSNLRLTGLHSHVSSYQEDDSGFKCRVQTLFECVKALKEQAGIVIDQVNIGGGFLPAIRLNASLQWQAHLDWELKLAAVASLYSAYFDYTTGPVIQVEPGRALCEAALVGLGQVLSVKKTAQGQYVFMDFSTAFAGGVHPAESCLVLMLYRHQRNELLPLYPHPAGQTVVCGPLCSDNDVFGRFSMKEKEVLRGDKIILLNAGAYTASFRWHGPEGLPVVQPFLFEAKECYEGS